LHGRGQRPITGQLKTAAAESPRQQHSEKRGACYPNEFDKHALTLNDRSTREAYGLRSALSNLQLSRAGPIPAESFDCVTFSAKIGHFH
jgi:hypothetical protein